MRTSNSTGAIFEAFVLAAKELQNPAKSQRVNSGSYSYTFAPLPDILDDVRGLLGKHDLAVVQEAVDPDVPPGIGVVTRIVHASGEWIEFGPLVLPTGGDAQSVGSAITYGRRYSLTAALGIAADEDDDAAKAAPRQANGGGERKATQAQIKKLAVLAGEQGWDDLERRTRAGVESFTDLTMRSASDLIERWSKLPKPEESPASKAPESESGGDDAGQDVAASSAESPDAGATGPTGVTQAVEGSENVGEGEATDADWQRLYKYVGDEARARTIVQSKYGTQTLLRSQMKELMADLLRTGER